MGFGGLSLRKLRARVSARPTGFVWVEKDRIAASGYPASRSQLEWVSREGINTLLTLTERPLPAGWLEGLPLQTFHSPMKDHEPPSLEALQKAVDIVLNEIRDGRRVLVHCLAGQGRTMCVVAAYLIAERGIEPEKAISRLRELRPGAVERSQERSVYEFANQRMKTLPRGS
jgi:atypical dual specificity phosphatase